MPPELLLPDPPLHADPVVLRPWAEADLGDLVAGAGDPLVHHYRYSLPQDSDQARAWLAAVGRDRSEGRRLELAITVDGEAVGSVALLAIDRRNRTAMVSYWLGQAGRGRGAGQAAVRLLAGWGFAELALLRLTAYIEVDNEASRRLVERCGFRREGRQRSHYARRDGTRTDVFVYGLLPGDLRAS